MNIQITAAIIATFAPVIPLIVYFITREEQNSAMKNIMFFIAVGFVSDLIGMVNALWLRNVLLQRITLNAYMLLSLLIIIIFFRAILPAKFKKWIFIFIPLFLIGSIYFNLTSTGGGQFEKMGAVIGLTTIILSLVYFYELIVAMPTIHIQRLPSFWVVTAFLIYSSSTLILFIVADYLYKHGQGETVSKFWIFHNFINLTQSVLFAIGLWQVTRKIKSI